MYDLRLVPYRKSAAASARLVSCGDFRWCEKSWNPILLIHNRDFGFHLRSPTEHAMTLGRRMTLQQFPTLPTRSEGIKGACWGRPQSFNSGLEMQPVSAIQIPPRSHNTAGSRRAPMTDCRELWTKLKALAVLAMVAVAIASVAIGIRALLPGEPHPHLTVVR